MIGKELKLTEYDLTFGKEASFIEVYACFKYKKNGNKYIVFKHKQDNKSILYYGSVYLKNNSILIIDVKDSDNLIKEFTHNLIYKKDLTNYEILDLKDIEKAEIVSENSFEVKTETLTTLNELTIPKVKVVEEIKPKKKSKGLVFVILFIILIAIAIIIYFYQDQIFGTKKDISCTNNYEHNELEAVVNEEMIFNFSRKTVLEKINKTITYTFKTSNDYNMFKTNNTYYKYTEENSTYKFDDINYKYIQFVPIDIKNNDLPEDYKEILNYYQSKKYTCTESNKNE